MNNELYIERSKVREIVIGHNAATQAVLSKIDALPIFTAEDFSGVAQCALWQPIEDAPQDGTCVLIAGGTFEVSNSLAGELKSSGVTIACYDKWEKLWQGENAGGHDEYYWHKPTHWLPIPAFTSTECGDPQ